jgi:hypothetical protein
MVQITKEELEQAQRAYVRSHPHSVTPTLDADGVGSISWAVRCEADANAWCRQSPHDERCDCDEYVGQRDGAGDWFHEHVTEDDEGHEVTEHHRMKGGEDCHIAEHLLVNGPHGVAAEFEGDEGTPVRAGRIDLTWQGDYWSWDYANNPPQPAS